MQSVEQPLTQPRRVPLPPAVLLRGHQPLAGRRVAVIRRVSTTLQVGNYSYLEQEDRLLEHIRQLGGEPVLVDENEDGRGVSGRDLSRRDKVLATLDDIDAGRLHDIAAWDIKRLTRDTFGGDAGVMAKRLAARHGLVVTIARIYNPRDKTDKMVFRVEGAVAGRDSDDIRDTMWRGVFGRMSREPFFKARPPIGYAVEKVPVYEGRDKLKRLPIKDPAAAGAMADLTRLLDECLSLADVARRMEERHAALLADRPKGKRGGLMAWWPSTIRQMLEHPVYWGEFQFGRHLYHRRKGDYSEIWEEDNRLGRLSEFRHLADGETPCPCGRDHSALGDLSYWTRADAQRWLAKFRRQPGVREKRGRTGIGRDATGSYVARPAHDHPLLGILACPACGEALIGAGKYGYRCPRYHTCGAPVTVSEHIAQAQLRLLFPTLMRRARGLAEALRKADERRASRGDGDTALARVERELRAKENWLDITTEQFYGSEKDPALVPDAMLRRMRDEHRAVIALRDKRDAVAAQAADERRASDALALLTQDGEQLEHLYEGMRPGQRAALLRELVADVAVQPIRPADRPRSGRPTGHQIVSYRFLHDETSVDDGTV